MHPWPLRKPACSLRRNFKGVDGILDTVKENLAKDFTWYREQSDSSPVVVVASVSFLWQYQYEIFGPVLLDGVVSSNALKELGQDRR